MENQKKCRVCKLIKLIDEFVKDKSYKDGISTICKKCKNEKNKENYGKHKQDDVVSEELCKLHQINKEFIDNFMNLNSDEIHNKILEIEEQMYRIRSMKCGNILILDKNTVIDEDFIKGKCQEIIANSLKKIIHPNQIKIEITNINIKVIFPDEFKFDDKIKEKMLEELK